MGRKEVKLSLFVDSMRLRESKSKFTFPLAKPLFNKSHELSGLRTDFKRLFPCI